MNRHGFLRIAAASPVVHLAAPRANATAILKQLAEHANADIVLFPELSLTGYSCEDLFHQEPLLSTARQQLIRLAEATSGQQQLVVLGLPLAIQNALYNTAAVLSGGQILGIVPKQFLPNYGEFYEARRFTPAVGGEPPIVEVEGRPVPFGIDLLFSTRDATGRRIGLGIEICEDLWVPLPPSSYQALAGASVLLNLSASNDVIGKRDYRRQLVTSQSGRCVAAYAYAGANLGESTTDLVFGGHCLVAENGQILAEDEALLLPENEGAEPLRQTAAVADVDIERLLHDRRGMVTFQETARLLPRGYRWIEFVLSERGKSDLKRAVSGTPFVPRDAVGVRASARRESPCLPRASEDLAARCREIFSIQCRALSRRLECLPADAPLQIGVSGGLDSTLALLVAVKTCDLIGSPRTRVRALTMPGFGTSQRTRGNAGALMEHLGLTPESIDIRPLCLEAFRELQHRPLGLDVTGMDVQELQEALSSQRDHNAEDLVFENVQARLRTFLLMSRGFVVGTGDLSEAALGWSTYNGDQMSMYNPNCSIPKTLVKFLVRDVARREFTGPARQTLLDIAETPISPELLPLSETGDLRQSTEQTLGPYELHDFFIYYVLRHGFGPAKILMLADQADFTHPYSPALIADTLRTFYRRFFANQFKRSCMPDGPKVGTVSLSPRGDWRMPSDAEATAWLAELEDEIISRGHSNAWEDQEE